LHAGQHIREHYANEAALSKLKNARSGSVGNQSERVDRVKAAHSNFPTALMQPGTKTFSQAACNGPKLYHGTWVSQVSGMFIRSLHGTMCDATIQLSGLQP
jgi:hypothetical protein